MAIILPTFENSFCQMVGVCSHFREAVLTRSLPSEDIEIVSSYRAHSGKAFVRLVWNPGVKHLHIDAALPAAFGKTLPSADTQMAKFRKVLANFEGLTSTALPHGSFTIPLSNLPKAGGLIFVGNSAIKLNTGKTEIELTGATLTFKRSQITRIRWSLLKENVLLDMNATRLELAIAKDFLTEVLRRLDSAVATYILGNKN